VRHPRPLSIAQGHCNGVWESSGVSTGSVGFERKVVGHQRPLMFPASVCRTPPMCCGSLGLKASGKSRSFSEARGENPREFWRRFLRLRRLTRAGIDKNTFRAVARWTSEAMEDPEAPLAQDSAVGCPLRGPGRRHWPASDKRVSKQQRQPGYPSKPHVSSQPSVV
jgi:hypothetical protein